MSDFVKPEPERLTLSGGHFIDVKKKLTHGESEDMKAEQSAVVDGLFTLNRRTFRTAKVLTYLLGWSLMDDGKPKAYSPEMPETARRDLLRSLSPERFGEIHAAIEAHEEAQAKASAAAGKIPDGVKESSAISPSPSDAGGATEMSESYPKTFSVS